jgi:YesN/AraC family two-component response regulator
LRYSCSTKDRSLPLVIDSVGYDWEQESVSRPQGYHYVHWIHTQNGEGYVEICGQTYHLSENKGILINEGVPHRYYANKAGWKTAYFTFGGALAKEIMLLLQLENYLYVEEDIPEIDALLLELLSKGNQDSNTFQYEISGRIYHFLMLIKQKNLLRQQSSYHYQEIVQPILSFIEKNYNQIITNQHLASEFGYTAQYLNKIFKDYMKISPNQYLANYRIQKAKELLVKERHLSIEDIAYQVGFQSVNYFITVFKKHEKVTPHQFRQYYSI